MPSWSSSDLVFPDFPEESDREDSARLSPSKLRRPTSFHLRVFSSRSTKPPRMLFCRMYRLCLGRAKFFQLCFCSPVAINVNFDCHTKATIPHMIVCNLSSFTDDIVGRRPPLLLLELLACPFFSSIVVQVVALLLFLASRHCLRDFTKVAAVLKSQYYQYTTRRGIPVEEIIRNAVFHVLYRSCILSGYHFLFHSVDLSIDPTYARNPD